MVHRVNFSDVDKRDIQRMNSQGMSYRVLARRYNVCKDTISNVVDGTWKPKPAKLPVEDSQLYLEYLMLGTHAAVARKYGVSDAPIRRRIKALVIREGV